MKEPGQVLSEIEKRIIDSHVHIWPDSLSRKNLENIKNQSGISPAFDGTVVSLHDSMKKSGVSISMINNIVHNPNLVRKANDWTAAAIVNQKDLIGMGWVIAGLDKSVEEVTRCVSELKFKGVKMHHSHSKIFPDDAKNYPIYEVISELGIPVLFHCGKNPYSKTSPIQHSAPVRFQQVLASFQKLKAIMGHLAGYEDYPNDAVDILQKFKNVKADTALAEPSRVEFEKLVEQIGAEKFVFGSDYPIYDPGYLVSWLEKSLPKDQFNLITRVTPTEFFGI